MEDNQCAAQAQKEYYECAATASEKLCRAKVLMANEPPQYDAALELLDDGLLSASKRNVPGVARRAGTTGDELMVRLHLLYVCNCLQTLFLLTNMLTCSNTVGISRCGAKSAKCIV